MHLQSGKKRGRRNKKKFQKTWKEQYSKPMCQAISLSHMAQRVYFQLSCVFEFSYFSSFLLNLFPTHFFASSLSHKLRQVIDYVSRVSAYKLCKCAYVIGYTHNERKSTTETIYAFFFLKFVSKLEFWLIFVVEREEKNIPEYPETSILKFPIARCG